MSDKLPTALIEAFRAVESVESMAVLLHEDGFDQAALRALSAWQHSDHSWTTPERPCPNDGKPTAAAWRWLVSTWEIDIDAIADAANVSRSTARSLIQLLIGNRLIYPDGTIAKAASSALRTVIGEQLQKAQHKDRDKVSKLERENRELREKLAKAGAAEEN